MPKRLHPPSHSAIGSPAGPLATTAALAAATLALLSLLLAGCASPGPPRPPSLRLPELVTNLTAERSGDDVILHWTTPAQSTDGLDLHQSLNVKICRRQLGTGSSPAAQAVSPQAPHPGSPQPAPPQCIPLPPVPAHPGQASVSAVDSLPAQLRVDPVSLLAYHVEVTNSAGRSAGLSPPAFAAAGPSPPPVLGLRVTPSAAGAVLEWQSEPGRNFVELQRLNQATPAAPKPVRQPRAASPAEPENVRLQVEEALARRPGQGVPAGTIDRNAHLGETYRYVARRVRHVLQDGHLLEIRSAVSPEVVAVMKDVFPPSPPQGLESVANMQPNTPPSIDLSWQPNVEPDLSGYIVYRRLEGAPAGPPDRLTREPIPIPAFRDLRISFGHTYAYSVTAVDKSGNESAPGPEAVQKIGLP